MSDFDEAYRLIYADEPGHIRLAGDPWAGIAKVVEQAMAVLEDGQRKLAEVWRSPGGTAYLAEMARVVAAMRATSEAARHNDRVMSAAADALDGKQKDFAILSTAPIPADARERYGRAIVNSLDEDYQQAVANFHEVPTFGPSFDQYRPLVADESGNTSSRTASPGDGSERVSGSLRTGRKSQGYPAWVPTQPGGKATGESSAAVAPGSSPPGTATADGPQLQGIAGNGTHSGNGTRPQSGMPSDTRPNTPSGFQPTSELPGAGPVRSGPLAVPPQTLPIRPGREPRSPARSQNPGTSYSEGEPLSGRPATAAMRAGVGGQPGAMVGGVPTGTSPASGGQRPWQGYRRAPEPFPTSRHTAVAPIIGPAPSIEPEPDEVSTDYEDEDGYRITIRRPRD